MQNTPATGADDPRCIPHKLTAPLPVGGECPYPAYTADEQDVWGTLHARMETLLPGRAADEFLVGLKALDLEKNRIPALADVSRKLQKATNWKIARTPGLLDAHDFFSHLARRIFPCTDYIPVPPELDTTPPPHTSPPTFAHPP